MNRNKSDHVTGSEMIQDYLERYEYDGLVSDGCDCACILGDLFPCCDFQLGCTAGYREDGCTCGEGCDFHIVAGHRPLHSREVDQDGK